MIVVQDLHKSFDDFKVLKGLNITVNEGETVVILGRSGVGKSVLLKHIIGILKPDSGKIFIDNTCISKLSERALYKFNKNTGMLFQSSALFDSMTIGENTAFYLRQHGNPDTGKQIPEAEIKDRVHNALEMVNLEETYDKMPSDMSGGMRKRAGIARLIVYRPRIILYDEPTTGLDPITAMHINELIIKTQTELQATSIVVTHDIRSALEVGDRLALHHDGKIVHISDKKSFMQSDNPIIKKFLANTGIPKKGEPQE